MFEELTEVFQKTYELAKQNRIDYEENGVKEKKVGANSEEILKSFITPDKNSARYKLDSYLNGLDFETVKIIQTIMYLGRDNEYKNLPNGESRYLKLREHFDKTGWNEQFIEVRQMTGKIPFDKYLRKGFKILDITV